MAKSKEMKYDYEHHLKELLAIIHRDGGHYTEKHGIEKSVKDAITIIYRNMEKAEFVDRHKK